ncbi:hypothetical protein SAMN06265361_101124 [Laceyella tengchongensis]|uniref:Uncharacterized protein n=1 Tax=Laceyella tengchongensis TaxID=574699 RepID=A0AA45WIJ0_9BACL|nr:hypothetical protein SAMN06265361_101124 [Laceyella tengchongensis]
MGLFGAKKIFYSIHVLARNLFGRFGTINGEVGTNNIVPRNNGQLRFRRLAFFDDDVNRRSGGYK